MMTLLMTFACTDGIVDDIDSCQKDTHIQFSQVISEAKLH